MRLHQEMIETKAQCLMNFLFDSRDGLLHQRTDQLAAAILLLACEYLKMNIFRLSEIAEFVNLTHHQLLQLKQSVQVALINC